MGGIVMSDIVTPELEFVLELHGVLAQPMVMGETPAGTRRIIPIRAGTFAGPHLSGTLVADGAADWQFTRPDNVTQAEAAYALRTDDGVLIQVNNYGLRHGPAPVMQRLAAGAEVDPAEYYFRTAPVFTAPVGRYDWLNRSIFIGSGARYPDAIRLRVYRVL